MGLQSQDPQAPYFGLFSRVRGFRPAELSDLIATRGAVRQSLLRATLHTVTARDALALTPVLAPVGERGLSASPFGRRLAGLDLGPVLEAGRALLDERPRTLAELRAELARGWPDRDPEALAYALRYLVPMVQIPPRGLWRRGGRATWARTQTWLGAELSADAAPDALVRRYLAAFGPATVADVRAWSGLADAGQAVERLRPRLRSLRDERGRELLDVAGGPLPDPAVGAPPRYLAPFDTVLVAYEDRTRLIAPADRDRVVRHLDRSYALIDGFVGAQWRIERPGRLVVEPFRPLGRRAAAALAAEGRRLLAFADPDVAEREVFVRAPA